MLARLLAAAVVVLGAVSAHAQYADPNLQNLLAGRGIINPSEDQIRTALVGGTLTTVNGVYQLPGLLPR